MGLWGRVAVRAPTRGCHTRLSPFHTSFWTLSAAKSKWNYVRSEASLPVGWLLRCEAPKVVLFLPEQCGMPASSLLLTVADADTSAEPHLSRMRALWLAVLLSG